MPKVPDNIDPGQLEATTRGQYQPQPVHLLMAAADMHDRGQLIEPAQQSGTRTGGNMSMPGPRTRMVRRRARGK